MRKPDRKSAEPDLESEPRRWLEEAAGSRVLINQTDGRFGVVDDRNGGLLLGGLLRGAGPIAPLHLARDHDPHGAPAGYSLLCGDDLLSADDRAVFRKLGRAFRFGDVQRAQGGRSGSNAQRLIDRCSHAQLVERDADGYRKT